MLKSILKRLSVGLCFALVAAALAVAVGEASETRQEGPVRTDCQDCHESVVVNWQAGAHGQSLADPVFQEAWQEQGSPSECLACHTSGYDPDTGTYESEGIACSVCHTPMSGPHPEMPMSTDPSSRQCGTCHVDTYAEWQVSAHGEGEMGCARCHNPHTTTLKKGNMGDLCSTCHNEEGHFYAYTAHAEQGLTCTDCHLRVSEGPMGDGHGQRVHTFDVDLNTCTECHGTQMHFPVSGEMTSSENYMWSAYEPEAEQVACTNAEPVLTDSPPQQPAQPLNYLLVAAVGLGFGMAITPWAEDLYRRVSRRD